MYQTVSWAFSSTCFQTWRANFYSFFTTSVSLSQKQGSVHFWNSGLSGLESSEGLGSPEPTHATEKPVTWGKAEIAGVPASQTKNRWARTISQVAFAQGFVIFNQMGKEINTSPIHPQVRSETYPSANSFPPQDYQAPLRAMADKQQQLRLTSCVFILYGRETLRGCQVNQFQTIISRSRYPSTWRQRLGGNYLGAGFST